ncbi:DUF3427 domain-containing protein [Putridiphycobacter roseus]|uniref:DUF3427 domain-containing protein n=1 Tax=Putridiphycobacter roseus TaxID=2219161 RepID=A0A2W1NPN1_9FLAO|nr:DUF3427 domain-containing protein [Putridiphycobacter roseus]PZE16578.1 DUF3427 domain-containing protein [Putridiphycobacter roseus]
MTKFLLDDFEKSLQTGFIDKSINSEILYRPELLVNSKKPKKKVLSTIISELEKCNSFFISVAFATADGVISLRNALESLEEKGIKGKIIVSQYLNFTQPEALRKLLKYRNIELRIATNSNSHSKGYLFKTDEHYNLIVGSSNLTGSALSQNKEWNLKVSATHSSEIAEKVLSEFNDDFNLGIAVNEDFIVEYEETYNKQKLFYNEASHKLKPKEIKPNSMQIEALENIKKLRSENKTKALLISATGTGKTYLSAFDAKAFQPKKLLFVVHRRTIAEKSLETFKSIFGISKSMGLYSGNKKELGKDFIFSTVQTISKSENLSQFAKKHFDYIIIDESHRSGADSYLRLLDYFTPNFLLGMTATPERTDGNDIFSLFDHNIAYEIRLNRAMEEEMLAPFHYFGVSDLTVNEAIYENEKDFNFLTADERVDKIITNANLYGSDNGITRGLIFCSKKEEAVELSMKFNSKGLKTVSLTGDDAEGLRKNAIERLESDDLNDKLDYIFTIDIFNEGIDIPKINQIIMLRPTDSSIIFIQQLGRGLRKTDGKDYVTVIDFIGNYSNNYLIPIALYGDNSYNKDSLRKLISEGSAMIPGSSTINFDRISKEKIFDAINSANMRKYLDLRNDYTLLKYKLGRIPLMMDFLEHGSRDPYLYVESSKSYYNFILKIEKEFTNELSDKEISLMELFSKEINNAKRIEESFILKKLLESKNLKIIEFQINILERYKYEIQRKTIDSCIRNINFDFVRKKENIIIENNNVLSFHPDFQIILNNKTFKAFLLDSINYSIETFEHSFNRQNYNNGLILYNKYSRKDVCRLLNWEKDISSTVYGYRTVEKTTPCFVTYNKSDDIEDSINYNDRFISPSEFAWESRSNRKLSSSEIQGVIKSERILLFVIKEDAKKNKDRNFYYMGDVTVKPESTKQTVMPDSLTPIVHFRFQLEQPVVENIYKYITTNLKETDNKVNLETELNLETRGKIIEKPTCKIPLYNFHAAAGNFSEMQQDKEYELISVPEKYSKDEYFACKVVGESMNRRIPNGSICIFKKYSGGTRNGKILLIENYDIQDQDFNSAFTVKTYTSQKTVSEEGWQHYEIVLKPNSTDSTYKDIIINAEECEGLVTIGEFVEIIK